MSIFYLILLSTIGLGKFAKSYRSKEVQLRFYSVEIYESTDLNTTNKIAIMLLYWDPKSGLKTGLLDVPVVENATAHGYFKFHCKPLTSLTFYFILLKLDWPPACHSESKQYSIKENGWIFIWHYKCNVRTKPLCNLFAAKGAAKTGGRCAYCHNIHLCSARACLKLPNELEETIRSVFSHFSCSPKRVTELIAFHQ